VIVEAALKSGSLITAKYALEQNREVFAVPGSPMDPRCKGTNQLLKQGAHICEGIEDIIENLGRSAQFQLCEDQSSNYGIQKTSVQNADEATRKHITSKLGYSPVQVDELMIQCDVTPDILSLVLLELELAGRLQRHPGHKVSLMAEYMDHSA
jgi:DNA processing protein